MAFCASVSGLLFFSFYFFRIYFIIFWVILSYLVSSVRFCMCLWHCHHSIYHIYKVKRRRSFIWNLFFCIFVCFCWFVCDRFAMRPYWPPRFSVLLRLRSQNLNVITNNNNNNIKSLRISAYWIRFLATVYFPSSFKSSFSLPHS